MSLSPDGRRELYEKFIERMEGMGKLEKLNKELFKLGATLEEVFGVEEYRKETHIVAARHYTWAFTAEIYPTFSFPVLARMFGVDHSTIMNAFQPRKKKRR